MQTFEIKEDSLLDGQLIKAISGAIYYFRMVSSQQEDSLYSLKALGASTAEIYILWNIHELEEGVYDFEGMRDIEVFVHLAEKLDLLVILRPPAYICAEREFGDLPAWLLKEKGVRLRSTDPIFMTKVHNYSQILLLKLAPLQVTQGGPTIMIQVESECGSYGIERAYLRRTKQTMEELKIEVPFFTPDGAWEEVLDAGALIKEDVFVTENFDSYSKENAAVLKKSMIRHGERWPLVYMKYWDGQFNHWGEPVVQREGTDLVKEVEDMLAVGSLNLYMSHGGMSFNFYNGCSA